MNEYTFSYRFDNRLWTVSIYANSEEEAKRKFYALKENGQYEGEIVCKIDVSKPTNFIRTMYIKIKSFMRL